jgi:hypothetical protein
LPATTENSYIDDSYSAGDAPTAVGANGSMLDHSAWLRVVAHTVRQLRQLDSSGVLPRDDHASGHVSDGESLAEVDDDCDDRYTVADADPDNAADEHNDNDNGSSGSAEQWPARHQRQQHQQQQQFEQQRSSQRAPSRAPVANNYNSASRNRGRSAPPARSRSKGASARLSSRSAEQRPYASSASPERSHNHQQQQQQQQQQYYSRTGQFSDSEQQQRRAARTRLHHTDGAKRGTRPAGLFEVTRPAHERVARARQQQQQQKPQYVERVTSRIGQQFAADRQAQQAAAKAQRAAALDTAARHR